MKTNILNAVRKQFAKKNITVVKETPDFDFSDYACFGTRWHYKEYLFNYFMVPSLKKDFGKFDSWFSYDYFGMLTTAVPKRLAKTIAEEISKENELNEFYIGFNFPVIGKGVRFDFESDKEATAARNVLFDVQSKNPSMKFWQHQNLNNDEAYESIVVFI